MTEMRGIGSPQQLLWTIGSSLIDADPGEAESHLRAALDAVCELTGAASGGLFEHDFAAGTNTTVMGRGVDPGHVGNVLPGAARMELLEGGGHAVLDLEQLFGDDYQTRLGWPPGKASVSLVDESADRITTLVLVAFEPEWGDDEAELLRGFGLLVRQFTRRIAAESSLRLRRELDEFSLALAERLQGLTGPD